MKDFFDDTTIILLGLCFLSITGCFTLLAKAQQPEPDTPFVPYTHIAKNTVRFCTQAELMDGTKLPEECDDLVVSEDIQADQCQQKVAITEPVDIKSVCWEKTTKVLNPDGLVKYMLIRPGCVALAMSQFRHNVEVYQDKDCWILLYDGTGKNQRWKLEKEGTIRNLQGA